MIDSIKVTQPNIFNFATSELSQDAFIAWLLAWANPVYSKEGNALHQLGLEFLQSLVAKQNIKLSNITDLKVITQFDKIDVFVSFSMCGESYALIIEDKVHSKNHSGQLEKYKKQIEKKGKYAIIVPIYFKTGFQHCHQSIIEKGYHTYTVKDFIKVLSKGVSEGIDHAVLLSYYEFLLKREVEYNDAKFAFENYKNVPISEWDWWSCTGFFNDYKSQFNAEWDSVGNNREPLLAFWYGGRMFSMKDAETDQVLEMEIYSDVQYTPRQLKIGVRVGLKGNKQHNNKNRNTIYNTYKLYLKKENISYKKAHFKAAKGTMKLLEISNIDKSIHYNELVLLLTKIEQLNERFSKEFRNA